MQVTMVKYLVKLHYIKIKLITFQTLHINTFTLFKLKKNLVAFLKEKKSQKEMYISSLQQFGRTGCSCDILMADSRQWIMLCNLTFLHFVLFPLAEIGTALNWLLSSTCEVTLCV